MAYWNISRRIKELEFAGEIIWKDKDSRTIALRL